MIGRPPPDGRELIALACALVAIVGTLIYCAISSICAAMGLLAR